MKYCKRKDPYAEVGMVIDNLKFIIWILIEDTIVLAQ